MEDSGHADNGVEDCKLGNLSVFSDSLNRALEFLNQFRI